MVILEGSEVTFTCSQGCSQEMLTGLGMFFNNLAHAVHKLREYRYTDIDFKDYIFY